jgi:hypothetical protein
MRKTWTMMLALAVAVMGTAAGCGSESTGVSLEISPDPVLASRTGDGTYGAEFDAVVADLTGVGGTIQSLEATVMGATSVSVTGRANPPGARLPSPNLAVAPFARVLVHQTTRFNVASGQTATVQVTVRFRDENGLTYDQTANAQVSLR